jgi:serine/threonine-protein kinase
LLDYGESEGLRYFVMPLINGFSLSDLMIKRALTPMAVRNLIAPVCEALTFAHGRGIVHRDIKPGNVMIEPHEGGSTQVYLMDFGLGKRIGSEVSINPTASNMTLGTPHYMAPEQVLGGPIDHRADLYSLAVMMYQMLLGRLPFVHENVQIVALRHVEAAPPPPRSLNPKFPKPIQSVLLRGLAKNPDERYRSATEFHHAYYDALKGLSEAERKAVYRLENAEKS